MNWADELWRKVFIRDTANWKRLSWQARTVCLHMIRKTDGAGLVDTGRSEPEENLAALLELPLEVVAPGIADLIKFETVDPVDGGYLLRNQIEAQSTPATDKTRKKAERERTRANRNLQARETTSTHVTGGHAASHGVTIRREEKREEEIRSDQKKISAAPVQAELPEIPPAPPPPPPPARAKSFGESCAEEFQAVRKDKFGELGIPFEPDEDLSPGFVMTAMKRLRSNCESDEEVFEVFDAFLEQPWAANYKPPFPLKALASDKVYPKLIASLRKERVIQ